MSQDKNFLDGLSEFAPFGAVRNSIRRKLLLGMLVVAFIPLLSLAAAVYWSAERTATDKTAAQLEAIKDLKTQQLQHYFQTLEGQVATFAENRMVVEALKDFRTSFRTVIEENELTKPDLEKLRQQLRTFYTNEFAELYKERANGKSSNITSALDALRDEAVFLQYQYVRGNPNRIGEKQLLDRAADKSAYSNQHAQVHPVIRSFRDRFGLHDICFVDAESGDVVYSCLKELDFSTSLKNGLSSKSGLGRAFAKAAAANSSDEVTFIDFEPYAPAYDAPTGFLAAPVFDGDVRIGVVVFQIPLDHVLAVMEQRSGLGSTGETYVVGPDNLFRSESRFVDDLVGSGRITRKTTSLNKEISVKTDAAGEALAGQSGTRVIQDYRGKSVLSSWRPVVIHADDSQESAGVTWGLISEIDLAEVRQPLQRLLLTMFGIAVASMIVVVLAASAVARNLTRQTDAITDMLSRIGIGDFDARVEVISEDELGTVALSLNAMCDNTLSLIQTREERDRIEHAVQKLKEEVAIIASGDLTRDAEVTDDVTGGVAESINHMIYQLRTVISNINEAATQVTQAATELRTTTDHLSTGTEHQATQIGGATSAIDQMAASIQEVSEHSEQSANVAHTARENAEQGTKAVQDTIQGMQRIRDQVQENAKRIKRLGESSQEVGEIVQLIGDIADRTSILALNASIQAAMAGDAGKGFAVVAEEVERLAERANLATKQIETLIKAIQSETSEAIAAMEDCTKEVVEGSQIAMQAGEALDEIDSVSKELADLLQSISRVTRQQAGSAEAIAKSMNEISGVTQRTAAGTKHTAESVNGLVTLADTLYDSVSAFRLPKVQPRPMHIFDGDHPREKLPMGSLILKALK